MSAPEPGSSPGGEEGCETEEKQRLNFPRNHACTLHQGHTEGGHGYDNSCHFTPEAHFSAPVNMRFCPSALLKSHVELIFE